MKYIHATEGEWIQGKGYKKRILLKKDDLHCDGALAQTVYIEPHTEVKAHYHANMTEVFHIIEGEATMTIRNRMFLLRPGDTLTCEPNEIHSARNDTDQPFRYVVFKTNAYEGDVYWLES